MHDRDQNFDTSSGSVFTPTDLSDSQAIKPPTRSVVSLLPGNLLCFVKANRGEHSSFLFPGSKSEQCLFSAELFPEVRWYYQDSMVFGSLHLIPRS